MSPDLPIAKPDSRSPIVFFDGVCGLCNSFVDFTLRRDRRAHLLFSPLQGEAFTVRVGETSQRVPGPRTNEYSPHSDRLASIVFWDGAQAHMKSEAVLRVIECLGGGWCLVCTLRLIPRVVRDSVYDLLAKNRYRWFGQRETCRLPSREQTDRFLP